MTRQSRHAAGWALALAVALLLEIAVVRPAVAPDLGVAPVSPSPQATGATEPGSVESQPPVVAWPQPVDGIAGSARLDLTPVPAEQATALQTALERARTKFRLDTLVVGVSVAGGLSWTGASGVARDRVTPITGDSVFVIGSVTKTFTAAIVLQLVQEGRLSLDAEVAALLPGVAVPAGVTVEQLLHHTSGIADLLKPLRPVLDNYTDHVFTPAEVAAAVGAVWWPPGKGWGYSNTNYVLLGMLIERVTGQTFAQALEGRVLKPLGMAGTGMLGQPGAPWLMPPAWVSAFWTSGSMYANAGDLLRWGDALYGGNVLRADIRRRMLAFDENDYGLGAEVVPVGDRPGYGHSGLLQGFTSLLVHLPYDDVTLVLLSTGPRYDPAQLLAAKEPGQLSIVDLAIGGEPAQPSPKQP